MVTVAVVLVSGFDETEAMTIVGVMRKSGVRVTLAGAGHPDPIVGSGLVRVVPDVDLAAITPAQYDLLVIPGGRKPFPADRELAGLLSRFSTSGRPIGAGCGATPLLAAAGIRIDERTIAIATRLTATPARDSRPVICQGTGSARDFARALVRRLGKESAAAATHDTPATVCSNAGQGQELVDGTIQALVSALEMKDPYTQGHAKRVTEYALGIGRCLNLPADELRDLYLGALLHDIGKLGTGETLLNKTESLLPAELELIREHPLRGTLMIVGIESLSHIVPTILHHHERWDGSGYPGKLRGEQIPLHARIVTVADAYDAMTSNRAYRKALDNGTVHRELLAGAHSQFDPLLVELFIDRLSVAGPCLAGFADCFFHDESFAMPLTVPHGTS